MDSLTDEVWDVVIAGTSLPQSLLALALSRSNKKVLHVDQNGYYGGEDAGFSLQDTADWTDHLKTHKSTRFSDAAIQELESSTDGSELPLLKASRSYTLSLNPQIIYAQSRFLPTLVSSQIHSQLEFLAVGSWWVHRDGALQKIPSTREDVFNDQSLSMRDKRSLMKFLRFVVQEDAHDEPLANSTLEEFLADALESRFKIAKPLQPPILALALSPNPANAVGLVDASTRIRRHMRSVGYFGPGFGAVIPKYGGNAEISQVACRAQAVGGGTYLLGHGVAAIEEPTDQDLNSDSFIKVRLSDGTEVTSRWVVGGIDDLPVHNDSAGSHNPDLVVSTTHSIDIVSTPLKHLLPATSENGPVPAAAIVLAHGGIDEAVAPVYLQVHSEDTGECPPGQSIIYGSVQSAYPDAVERLQTAVEKVLDSDPLGTTSRSLWRMTYVTHQPKTLQFLHTKTSEDSRSRVLFLPCRSHDISLQDETLDNVEYVWTAIMGSDAGGKPFLRFEEREQEMDAETVV